MKGWLTTSFLLCAFFGFAQIPAFHGSFIQNKTSDPALTAHFYEYEVFTFDVDALRTAIKNDDLDLQFKLQLGSDYDWTMYLYPSNLRNEDYLLRLATTSGIEIGTPNLEVKAFKGELIGNGGGSVRLTMDKHFLYGAITQNGETYFIEPLNYFDPSAANGEYVFYNASAVIPYEGNACGVTEMHIEKHKHEKGIEEARLTGLCYEVDLAIASDGLMFNSYGSVAAVENHNIGVMNNVAGNYDDEFADEIQFLIVEQFVSTSPAADPWTASTAAGTLLDDFTDWGPTGFSVTHDLGSLWTDRNFNGGTIGIAWLSAVCTSIRYHCLQDFTTNAAFLRVLTSHEIGHNFSSGHDGSGTFIMSPTVNGSNSWSANSVNVINNYYPSRPCLSLCPPPTPPVPIFSSNINNLCVGSMVTFYDESLFNPNSWTWSFPGATPTSSSDQNPTVTYANPGVYNVTLTVANANGSSSITQNGFIIVSPGGGTDFFFRSDFESGPGGWTTVNPDNDETWTNEAIGGSREGVRAMKMDNFNYNAQGERDGLVSPTIDLSGRSSITLEIDYAYRRYNSNFRDSMVVYVSTNNGASFPNRIFADTENGSGNFATAAASTSDFTPGQLDDWCFGGGFGNSCLSLDLSPFAGEPNVKIKIENVNGFGNNMFIDNVRVLSDCQVLNPPIAAFSGTPTEGCVPMTVQFTDESQNNPITWIWSMPGAIPPSSTMQNPIVIYTQPGVYDVTLTVVNLAGANTVTETSYITVNGPPVSDFIYDINGFDVDFTDISDGTIDTYIWSFGDGESSGDQNPSHNYDEDGTYLVSLTIIGPCGSNTFQTEVVIATPPIAAFSSNVTAGCVPLGVQFIDQSTTNTTSWNWSFPGGNPATSTVQNPFVTYDTPGTYDVTLIASNATGSSTITETSYIVVDDVPSADFNFNISGQMVDFTNNSINADSYSWDFGDGVGTSAAANPTYTYLMDGNYTVILEATNSCGTDVFELLVQISNIPIPAFSTDVTSGCAPLTIQFTDESSSNADSWSWQFPGGTPATSDLQNPTVVYSNAGVYDVILTVANAAGSNTITEIAYISVDDVPDASFSSTVLDLTVDFTNNTTNATSYSWDFGDGIGTSVETNPSYTYGADGTYNVVLTATNGCGSVNISESVTVSTIPIPDFSADITSGCAPLTVQFMDQSSSNAISWSWSFQGGTPATSMDQNPLITYSTPGLYHVTLTVGNASGSYSVTVIDYIEVLDVPSASFTESVNGATVDLINTSTGATSYSWDFGDGIGTSMAADPSYTYTSDGNYTIILSATNDCGTVMTSETVTIVTPPTADFTMDPSSGCAPLTVQFTDASSSNTASWNWSFPGGNPSTSDLQNPIVEYASAGTYSVTLEVANGAGADVVTQVDAIIVNDVPDSDFTSVTNGATVDFTNTSTGATSYLWDFGDSMGTSMEVNPSYTYNADGTYNVTLSATNDCGTIISTETIVIELAPTAGFTMDPSTGCAPLSVQFMNTSSSNATSWNWSFPGGTPTTSMDENPLVEYATPGVYSVTLEVANGAGSDVITQTDVIVVQDTPEADFSVSVSGATVDITNNSTGATSFDWDFGDDIGTSMATNPSYTYPEDGDYTITLSATNDCGTITTTQSVSIQTLPLAGFDSDIQEGCLPLTVQFNNLSSSNAETFSWSFPGGTPATSMDENPIVVYETAGTFSVTLTVANAAGQSTVMEPNYIIVNDVPTVGFMSSINGAMVDFTNNSTGATSYDWDFGDGVGTSMETTPTYTYGMDGVFTVTLTATNECGSVTTEMNVAIATAGPVALFSASAESGCAPFEVQFFNESSANTESIEWSFPGGNPSTSTEENPIVVYDTPGNYDVTLTATNANGDDVYSQTQFITVLANPIAAFSTDVMGPTVDFTNLSSDADTYSWFFGEGGLSGMENPSYTYDQVGTYPVVLVVENTCGVDSFFVDVEIEAVIPQATFSADSQTGCAPMTVQFMDESSGSPTEWDWTFENGIPATSTEQNPVVVFETPGVYDVSLTVSNLAGENMLVQSQYITVLDVPDAEFGFTIDGFEVVFNNTSQGGTSFEWDFGDDSGSNNPSPSHVYDEDGTYVVILSVTNECGTSTFEQELVIDVTSIDEIKFVDRFEIYPNPNDGQFQVILQGQAGVYKDLNLRLYNVLGQQLYNADVNFELGNLQQELDVRNLAKGVYFFQIQAGDQFLIKEVIIQ